MWALHHSVGLPWVQVEPGRRLVSRASYQVGCWNPWVVAFIMVSMLRNLSIVTCLLLMDGFLKGTGVLWLHLLLS